MSVGLDRAHAAAVPGGPTEKPLRYVPFGQQAYKVPVTPPFAQYKGPAPNMQPRPWIKKYIPPLALFNDASQWVNRLMFNRPMPFMMAPNSIPPLQAQYFTPPPIDNVRNLAAGQANLQRQLGNLKIQAARLDNRASNYYGG